MGLVCCFFKSFRPEQLDQPSSGLVYPAEKGLRRGEATASGGGAGAGGLAPPSSARRCYCSVLSRIQLFAPPWTAAHQASLSFTNSWSLLKLMSIESVISSDHLILCHTLLLLPSIFPSIRVFSNALALLIRWPKYWSFSISPSNKYSGLISFRMDWLDLLAVQGTLKSLLQHHSSKASVLQCSAFFMVQLTSVHPGRLGAPDPRLAAP